MLDRFNENEIDFDVYLEAKSDDPEINKKRTLAKLKYNPINKTIEIKGIDGKPYRCRVTFASNDLLSISGTEGFGAMRRQIYANQMPDGTPYIRIPPDLLREKSPSELLPVIEHEAEHVRQLLNKKHFRGGGDKEMSYVEARDKKAVIEYTKEYIKKHPMALNAHDKLDYELLADFHAALKYGRKSYAKALRGLASYNFSFRKYKKAVDAAYSDLYPLLDLYNKGERTVGPYVTKLEKHLRSMKKALKNVQESEKNNKNNKQSVEPIPGVKVTAGDTFSTLRLTVETLVDMTEEQLDQLKKLDPKAKLPKDVLDARKQEATAKKAMTSFSKLATLFGQNIISTEYRIKFLKEIMKDKPWLKDEESKYRTTYESYVPLEFDDWDIDDALFQEEFEDELIAGADVDYDTFTEEYIDTLAEYLFN